MLIYQNVYVYMYFNLYLQPVQLKLSKAAVTHLRKPVFCKAIFVKWSGVWPSHGSYGVNMEIRG